MLCSPQFTVSVWGLCTERSWLPGLCPWLHSDRRLVPLAPDGQLTALSVLEMSSCLRLKVLWKAFLYLSTHRTKGMGMKAWMQRDRLQNLLKHLFPNSESLHPIRVTFCANNEFWNIFLLGTCSVFLSYSHTPLCHLACEGHCFTRPPFSILSLTVSPESERESRLKNLLPFLPLADAAASENRCGRCLFPL